MQREPVLWTKDTESGVEMSRWPFWLVKMDTLGLASEWPMGGTDIGVSRRLDYEGVLQTLLGELLAEFGSW